MQFSFNDILDFRISLAALANFYYVGEQCFISEKKTNSNSLSISINRKELKMYIQGVLHNCFNRKINNQALDELLDFYTYGNNDIWDLFFNPLIKYRDKYIIIPFVVMQTDFGRIFINHLNKLDIQLKGPP